MSTPDTTKTLRVSPETHALVMDHARRIRGTVDEAVADLVDESTVRVLLGSGQRDRWEQEAAQRGMRLGELIRLLVEVAMTVNAEMIAATHFNVRAMTAYHGIRPAGPGSKTVPTTVPGPQQ